VKTMWNASDRKELGDRLSRLEPGASRRWGTMTAPQMLAHLTDALRMAVGEIAIPSKKLPIRYTPLKQLIIYWLPFPKGAPTAPEIVSRVAADWPSECATLAGLMQRFAERDRAARWPDHPAFGRLTGNAWGVLVYRHMDHHFRQFGV
jgi:hypothetical protein